MRPNLDERTQNPRHESPYTRTSTTPPPCSAPGPPVPPNSAFSSPPTPPLPPRQKLPITQWNRPADFFAPRNEREGPQTRWMRVAGCCEWRVRKCACACPGGLKAGPTNLVNRTAASVASLGRAGQESGDHLRQELAPAITTTTRHKEAAPALQHKTRGPRQTRETHLQVAGRRTRSRGRRTPKNRPSMPSKMGIFF